jgi:hypothetical protein
MVERNPVDEAMCSKKLQLFAWLTALNCIILCKLCPMFLGGKVDLAARRWSSFLPLTIAKQSTNQ